MKKKPTLTRRLLMSEEELREAAAERRWADVKCRTINFGIIAQLLLENRKQTDPFVGAEIGVFRGGMSREILRTLPNCVLYLVDRWGPPKEGDSYLTTVDLQAFRTFANHQEDERLCRKLLEFAGPRAVYLKMELGQAALQVEDGSLDFIYLDADHSKRGTKRAWKRWEPKVKPGGIVAGHDWGTYGVTEAMEECVDKDTAICVDRATWAYRKAEQR